MRSEVHIGGRPVGPGHPLFIVIEVGTTCNGDLESALKIVDASAEAGADAVKFMVINPDEFMSDKTVVYDYENSGGKTSENMYEMFKGLMFTDEEWVQINQRAKERGIIMFATVDYLAGVDLGEKLGMPAYKLSSWDARHFKLIRKMAATGKPVQLDLGPVRLGEIEKILDVMKEEGNDQALLLHCTHATTKEEVNLLSIPYLHETFGCPVGFSADSRDFVSDLGSIALGSHTIEKRLTLNKDQEGHHHVKALEPAELKEWVSMVRGLEAMMGKRTVEPSAEDLRQKELYFVSLVANEAIPAGTAITNDMLSLKRPGSGIDPELIDVFIGRKAVRDIKENELITWDMI